MSDDLGAVDPRSLLAAGWSEEDLRWESLQLSGSAEDRAEALRLARQAFRKDDPRLAASLINCAANLPPDDGARDALLREAFGIWRGCETWLAEMKPERRARSSTYHLRMEAKYPGGYDRFSEERHRALAEEGLRAAEAHLAGAAWPDQRARWEKERPEGFNDLRKLLAAVLLIAPAGPAR
jgi:hypothetical protein